MAGKNTETILKSHEDISGTTEGPVTATIGSHTAEYTDTEVKITGDGVDGELVVRDKAHASEIASLLLVYR